MRQHHQTKTTMSNKINAIVCILEPRDARQVGFRYTRCSDGKTVEAMTTAAEGNIRWALGYDGKDFLRDVFFVTVPAKQRDLDKLTCIGSSPDEIRKWTRANLCDDEPASEA